MWQISEESMHALRFQLDNDKSAHEKMKFNINLVFQRPRLDKTREPIYHSISFSVPIVDDLRKQLSSVLSGNNTNRQVIKVLLIK